MTGSAKLINMKHKVLDDSLKEKLNKLLHGDPFDEIEIINNEIMDLDGIKVLEQKRAVFFNMYGDYPSCYSLYQLDNFEFEEGNMDDVDTLWYNLQKQEIKSICLEKIRSGKIILRSYEFSDGKVKISKEKFGEATPAT